MRLASSYWKEGQKNSWPRGPRRRYYRNLVPVLELYLQANSEMYMKLNDYVRDAVRQLKAKV